MKRLAVTAAIVGLMASPAFGQSLSQQQTAMTHGYGTHSSVHSPTRGAWTRAQASAPYAFAPQPQAHLGAGPFAQAGVEPDLYDPSISVFADGKVIGQDPDPLVRQMLQQQALAETGH